MRVQLMNKRIPDAPSSAAAADLRYLKITVRPAPGIASVEDVSIRVPLKLLKAGIKLITLLPSELRLHIDDCLRQRNISPESLWASEHRLEELVTKLNEPEALDGAASRVRICFE